MQLEVSLGDVVECPHCRKEFEINDVDEDNYNDFDIYFEHVSTCG